MKTAEQKTDECRQFRISFRRALPRIAKQMASENPDLHIDQDQVFACDYSLTIEFTEPLRLLVSTLDHTDGDLWETLCFYPYFDPNDNLRYFENPDAAGFSTPEALAEHCILWLLDAPRFIGDHRIARQA